MKRVLSVVALALMLAACNKGSVKPPTVVEVSCSSAAAMWYKAGSKYHAGKFTEQDVADLKADAKVIDPKCTASVEPSTDELMKDPAFVAAFADLAKKATN